MHHLYSLPVLLAVAGLAFSPAASAAPHRPPVDAFDTELAAEMQQDNVYKAYFPSLEIARKAVISFHNQLLEAKYDEGYLILELNDSEIAQLRTFNFRVERAGDYIEQRKNVLTMMQAERLKQHQEQAKSLDSQKAAIATIPGYSCYETVEGTFTVAQGMVASYPNLATWTSVGSSWQKTTNQGGYDLFVLKLTNSATAGPKPKLFVQSAIHAREYATTPLVLEFARWLTSGYGTNADATWIMDHHEVHLMLHANPDGRKKAETGLSWRKNTNQNYCGATSNTRGADLNRNFGFTWNSTGGSGSSGNECDITYRGAGPASEPEVQAIESYVRTLWPDNRGTAITDAAPTTTSGIHLDIHSYGALVLWPWGTTTAPSGNAMALQTLGRKFAFLNGHTPQQSVGLYPTDGTSDSVSYGELGVAAFVFELGSQFFQSCSYYNSNIKPGNLNALRYAAKVVRTPYLTPTGPDVTSVSVSGSASTTGVTAGTAVTLSATISDARFSTANGTEPTQPISAAEYYVDVPPWQSGTPVALAATDGAFSAVTENVSGSISTAGLSVGKHTVFVRGKDQSGAWGAFSAVFLVIK